MLAGKSRTFIYPLLYPVIFGILLIQFPLNQTLPGSTDTWLYLAEFNIYKNILEQLFTGANFGVVNFPEGHIYLYGEPSFLSALFFIPFKWVGLNDLWSYYCFLTSVFALNAIALYLLSYLVLKHRAAAFYAALIVCCSNFTLSNLDNQNAFVFFPLAFSAYYLIKFFRTAKFNYVVISGLLCGLQVYFSSYLFAFALLIHCLIYFVHLLFVNRVTKEIILGAFILFSSSLIIASPFIYFFLYRSAIPDFYDNILTLDLIDQLGLTFRDFFRVLPDNLLYQGLFDYDSTAYYHWHAAFIGFLTWVISMLGWVLADRKLKIFLSLLFLAGILFSLGPYISFGSVSFHSPMYWLYAAFPQLIGIKHISRFFFLSIFALSILSGIGIKAILTYFESNLAKIVLFTMLIGIFLIENVPIPLPQFEAKKYLHVPDELFELKSSISPTASLIHMPAFTPYVSSDAEKYGEARKNEYVFMFWQTFHHMNILNGANGFVPANRYTIHLLTEKITSDRALTALNQRYSLQYIVWHKWIDFDQDRLSLLKANSSLDIVEENKNLIIFEINK